MQVATEVAMPDAILGVFSTSLPTYLYLTTYLPNLLIQIHNYLAIYIPNYLLTYVPT